MKICPTCQTQYNDGSVRFCTKDGTPLIAYVPPVSEPPVISKPLPLDATLSDIPISRNQLKDEIDLQLASSSTEFVPIKESEQRPIAVEEPPAESVNPPPTPIVVKTPPVREVTPHATAAVPKRKSKVALFAFLGAFGLIMLLGVLGALGAYWYFSFGNKKVTVINTNVNLENSNDIPANDNSADINDNSIDLSVNNGGTEDLDVVDANLNANKNSNINARPSPSPRLSPSPKNANRNANLVLEGDNVMQPAPTPIVNQTPTPLPATPQPQQGIKTVAGGVVNGKASSLIKPAYPAAAKAVRAEGQVNVQVLIDESGNVVSASAISGNPLLRAAAQQAARQSKFPPTVVSGQPVRVSGVIIYNFTMNQ